MKPRLLSLFLAIGLGGGFALCADEPSNLSHPTQTAPTKTLTETDAIALLTAALQKDFIKDKGELELNFTQPWTAPTVPDQPLTVKVLELPAAGVTSSFILRFQLCTATGTAGTWQMAMQAHVWRDVWVARSGLIRGALAADADIARERRDVLNVRETLADFTPGDSSLELATSIPSGNLLLARDLKPRAVLHRGQTANAILSDGSLDITLKVEVLEDGAPGQVIRVRNATSQRYLSGKVMDEQTIAVSL